MRSPHPAGAASAVERALLRDVPLPGGEDAVGGTGGAAATEVPRAGDQNSDLFTCCRWWCAVMFRLLKFATLISLLMCMSLLLNSYHFICAGIVLSSFTAYVCEILSAPIGVCNKIFD